jgi:hypothetical protein
VSEQRTELVDQFREIRTPHVTATAGRLEIAEVPTTGATDQVADDDATGDDVAGVPRRRVVRLASTS